VIDHAALRMMQRTMARSGPRLGADTRERVLSLAAHYRGVDLFAHPEPTQIVVEERSARRGSRVIDVSFASRYRPSLPAYVDEYASYRANLTARARLFTGPEPRPCAILIHGWGSGAFFLEERAFPVHYLRRVGIDPVLFQLPFHGLRAPLQGPRSGSLFPSPHLVRTNEGFGQAISDLRLLADWLRRRGAPAVGVIGMSLGAYTSALWASLDAELAFCVPMIPAADMAELMWRHGSAGRQRARSEKHGVTRAMVSAVFAPHAPLLRPVLVPPERLFLIAGEGDQITPPDQAQALWAHWGRPEIHWFPGGHLAQIGRSDAFRALRRKLAALGFAR
jgi:pimeloyl-ACP methyl ester carboxylesterase